MLKNYLEVALRNIKRYKSYSLINIAGLAIEMGCCVKTEGSLQIDGKNAIYCLL